MYSVPGGSVNLHSICSSAQNLTPSLLDRILFSICHSPQTDEKFDCFLRFCTDSIFSPKYSAFKYPTTLKRYFKANLTMTTTSTPQCRHYCETFKLNQTMFSYHHTNDTSPSDLILSIPFVLEKGEMYCKHIS